MSQKFADALVNAQGRSEFVIVVVADIRGFSSFSIVNESPNIAMFIKRFYLQLINKYFTNANFVKPTGDGLLMTFPYSETDLLDVAEKVIVSCLSCLNDFPNICKDDPMINFPVPETIGFGISRGTACCLYSGEEILDYSGHLLNLASRLNDLARPSGIVIDGGFLKSVLSESTSELFEEQQVYVRSISEDVPMNIYYLRDLVKLSDLSLNPISNDNWQTKSREIPMKDLHKLAPRVHIELKAKAKSKDKIKVSYLIPKVGIKGVQKYRNFTHFEYNEDGPIPRIILDMKKMRELILKTYPTIKPNAKITLKVDYVPK